MRKIVPHGVEMRSQWAIRLMVMCWMVLTVPVAFAEPRCIVPLTPALAEMVAELLPQHLERICGVTEYSDRPAVLKNKPHVGRYDHLSLETLLALHPDLVIAAREENSQRQIARLAQWHVPVLLTTTPRLEAIPTTLAAVGERIGEKEAGTRAARALHAAFAGFRARTQAKKAPKPRVFLQLGDAPLIGVGAESFLSEALEWVGAQNILSDQKSAYPRISRELVIQRKPDLILVLALGGQESEFQKMALRWQGVCGGSVRILRADALMRPNASIVEGLFLLEKAVATGGSS